MNARGIVAIGVLVASQLAGAAVARAGTAGSVFLRAGVATSEFAGSFSDVVGDRRSDFAGAVGVRVPLGGALSFQPELGWLSRGGVMGKGLVTIISTGSAGTDTTSFTTPESDWIVREIELPLLLRYEPGAGLLRAFFVGGIAPAWRTGGRVETHDEPRIVPTADPAIRGARIFENLGDFNPIENFRTFDLGAVAGAGIIYGHSTRLSLDVRWIEGLLNVAPESSPYEARNRSIVVSLGVEGMLGPP